MYNTYKNLSDEEWETLEYKSDQYIIEKYKHKYKFFKEIVKMFAAEPLENIAKQFPVYNETKYTFDFDYFHEEDFPEEEWKQIGNMNYSISNYGRIKNTNTKKLKQLKFTKYGMQVLLWQNSKSYTITISRLVAEFFIRHVEKNERVFHKNKRIRDNHYKNLYIE